MSSSLREAVWEVGKGLAEAFHARGNQVIIAARREGRLNQSSKPSFPKLMKELEWDSDEIVVGEAKRVVAATCLDSVKKAFSAMKG